MKWSLSENLLERLELLLMTEILRFKVDILLAKKNLRKKIPTLSGNISITDQPLSLPNNFSDRAYFILKEHSPLILTCPILRKKVLRKVTFVRFTQYTPVQTEI